MARLFDFAQSKLGRALPNSFFHSGHVLTMFVCSVTVEGGADAEEIESDNLNRLWNNH